MLWHSDSIAEISVWAEDAAFKVQAEALAKRLQLPLQRDSRALQLCFTTTQLELRDLREAAPGPIAVDFVGGKSGHRRQFGGGRGQTIAKACGLKSGLLPSVVDATGGMGRDAFVLASLGCELTLIERSPVIHALLEDGLHRASLHTDTAETAARIKLVCASSIDWLSQHPQPAEVVYLDPMYPHRDKSALVKKEMRYFRELVGDDSDAGELLEAAWSAQPARVVVKRPKGAPLLNSRTPSTRVESKNTRYDIYVHRKISAE